MKNSTASGERRKHPRFYPDHNNLPKVSFHFEDGEQLSVDLINISRGGMFVSTPQIEQFLESDHQQIKIIEIVPPQRAPFRCSGKLLRLLPWF